MTKLLHDSTIQFKQMLSGRHRAREAVLTTILWMIYGYLWLPLISFVAWYFGIDFAYERVIKAGGPDQLILLLLWFFIIFLVILLIVVTWSGLQYSLYKGDGERRTRGTVFDLAAEREVWQIDEALQQQMKTAKVQTVTLDKVAVRIVVPGTNL
jgi:biofilm PGA synthesis protein PgaD